MKNTDTATETLSSSIGNESSLKKQPHSKHFYYMMYIIVGLFGISIILGLIGWIGHSWISASNQASIPQVEQPTTIVYEKRIDAHESSHKGNSKKNDKDDDDEIDYEEIIGNVIKGAIKIIPAFL